MLVCKYKTATYIIRASGRLLGMDKLSGTEVEASIDHAAELVGVSALKPLQREAIPVAVNTHLCARKRRFCFALRKIPLLCHTSPSI